MGDFSPARVNDLLDKLEKHEQFSKSEPPFDFDYLGQLVGDWGYDAVRHELNNMNQWWMADKEKNHRKNWRMTLLTFLRRGRLHVCPKCNHRFKG